MLQAATAPLLAPPPALTVAAVVERDGHFLMVEEWAHGKRVINQPAGHVEAGESLLAAVARETLEETGWTFAPEATTGVYLWQRPGTDQSFLRVAFAGSCLRHDPMRRLDRGIIRALWMTRSDLQHRAGCLRSPMVIRVVDDYLAGARAPLGQLNNAPPAAILQLASLI